MCPVESLTDWYTIFADPGSYGAPIYCSSEAVYPLYGARPSLTPPPQGRVLTALHYYAGAVRRAQVDDRLPVPHVLHLPRAAGARGRVGVLLQRCRAGVHLRRAGLPARAGPRQRHLCRAALYAACPAYSARGRSGQLTRPSCPRRMARGPADYSFPYILLVIIALKVQPSAIFSIRDVRDALVVRADAGGVGLKRGPTVVSVVVPPPTRPACCTRCTGSGSWRARCATR